MSLQINDVAPDFDATDFERVRPHLLDLVQGTTACSQMVFYGLLARGQTSRPAIFQTRTRRQSTQGGCYEQFSASRSSCSQTNMEGKSYFSSRSRGSRLGCCQLEK
jgi:hypothetical protein